MATYQNNPLLVENKIAAEDLEANRLVIIDPTTDTLVRYPENDHDTQLFGVTLEAAKNGKPVDIAVLGVVLLKVDGNAANIAFGDPISAHGTDGFGGKADTTADTTTEIIGKAMGASTADGDLIPVLLTHGWYATESA